MYICHILVTVPAKTVTQLEGSLEGWVRREEGERMKKGHFLQSLATAAAAVMVAAAFLSCYSSWNTEHMLGLSVHLQVM